MKRIISVLMAIAIVLPVMMGVFTPVCAESLYIRKIVSVVYDDSGSMSGNKWAYANYAMQAFCGMLNSEDQLFITYMSHSQQVSGYKPEKADLSAGGIQGSVDSIRAHTDSGSTPYMAVETAYNKLTSVQDSNPNTQYWLVVITDGAFDEMTSMSDKAAKKFVNERFDYYTEGTMPNGTKPQITFLGIGDVISPDEDQSKGIYTYSAQNADGIIDAMSQMADRISGRTRLQKSDIKKVDDHTIQVSSSIPLLNIAVFVQGSDAKLTKAVYSNEKNIPISRKVDLSYPGHSDLIGGAYLVGDSKNVIGSGTYEFTFDRSVELEDVIILFEPALEMRMKLLVNGKEITDQRELDALMEGDKVSVSCKIYEMGTDTEIDPSLLPPGTKYEITVAEAGQVVKQNAGQDMLLSDFELKNIETEITAAVIIEGFNPISYSEKFTPSKYVPRVVYTIKPSFGSDVKSVKIDDIASNQDLTVCFTVYADGAPITDVNAVKALSPVITASPQGNSGTVTYSDDGKIVFTPNAAPLATGSHGSFDVDVTCTIDSGITAMQTYTVLIADYQVIPVAPSESIKKTEFYGNQVGASFYITKDGTKLDKAAVEQHISVVLDEAHQELLYRVEVSDDGVITVTPYSDQEWHLNFGTWWANGWRYLFALEGSDVQVTLSHSYGTATNVIDVTEEDLMYIIFNVAAPIILELAIVITLLAYIYCVRAKPKFSSNAVLYSGTMYFDTYTNTHEIMGMRRTKLATFNKFKYRYRFTTKSMVVSAGGIRVSAVRGGMIECYESGPAFSGNISFVHDQTKQLPNEIMSYCRETGVSFTINPFSPITTITGSSVGTLSPTSAQYPTYFVAKAVLPGEGQPFVIENGKIFVYLTEL